MGCDTRLTRDPIHTAPHAQQFRSARAVDMLLCRGWGGRNTTSRPPPPLAVPRPLVPPLPTRVPKLRYSAGVGGPESPTAGRSRRVARALTTSGRPRGRRPPLAADMRRRASCCSTARCESSRGCTAPSPSGAGRRGAARGARAARQRARRRRLGRARERSRARRACAAARSLRTRTAARARRAAGLGTKRLLGRGGLTGGRDGVVAEGAGMGEAAARGSGRLTGAALRAQAVIEDLNLDRLHDASVEDLAHASQRVALVPGTRARRKSVVGAAECARRRCVRRHGWRAGALVQNAAGTARAARAHTCARIGPCTRNGGRHAALRQACGTAAAAPHPSTSSLRSAMGCGRRARSARGQSTSSSARTVIGCALSCPSGAYCVTACPTTECP
eukprot:7390481-Prymnesium_polylepis.1